MAKLREADTGTRDSNTRILIRVPNWVGDVVMALPALRELRRIFSASHITIAGKPWVLGLFEGEALADDVIPLSETAGRVKRISALLKEASQFRRKRFDIAVLLTNSFGTALAARLGGAEKIAGYSTDARRVLINRVIPFEPGYKTLHQTRYYLNISAHVENDIAGKNSVNFDQAEPRLTVDESQKRQARSKLEQFGILGNAPILAINPGATNSAAKRWPAERFAAAADRLADRAGFQTVIVGAMGDKPVAHQVAQLMRTRPVVLAGETSIAELKGVLSCAALVISNDTGTAHVSAALGIPTVVVFGPTEHVSTRPLSHRAAVVRHDVECSPCMLRECPIDHRCMTRVEVDDVYTAAQNLLANV
ncbi:MAG TPA: lipopolysaccharide heptosyltransferase II [Blastocatellia bacterium]|nr:lipopolysaccharide heptosyltransferase II [Blastocatellia bacterium]